MKTIREWVDENRFMLETLDPEAIIAAWEQYKLLGSVAAAEYKPTQCDHRIAYPTCTLVWHGSSLDPTANTWLYRCLVCNSYMDLPLNMAQDSNVQIMVDDVQYARVNAVIGTLASIFKRDEET